VNSGSLDDRLIEGETDARRIEDGKLLGSPGFHGQLTVGMYDPFRLILGIELLDVLDVNTETGLFRDISVSVAAEKNFDRIALNDGHLGGLPLGIPGRKTELLHIEGERGIDITPSGNEGAEIPQDRCVRHDVSF
jgi:hypothetical protein